MRACLCMFLGKKTAFTSRGKSAQGRALYMHTVDIAPDCGNEAADTVLGHQGGIEVRQGDPENGTAI